MFGDSRDIVHSISAECEDDSSIDKDDRPMLIVTNEADLDPVINSLKDSLTV